MKRFLLFALLLLSACEDRIRDDFAVAWLRYRPEHVSCAGSDCDP